MLNKKTLLTLNYKKSSKMISLQKHNAQNSLSVNSRRSTLSKLRKTSRN